MKHIIILISLFACLSCTKDPRAYDNSVMDLGLGFVAKQMCSCLYVVGQDETFCRDFVRIKQLNPKIIVHSNSVETRYFYFFRAQAQYSGESQSCQLN